MRVSEDVKARIQENAKACGLSVTDFIELRCAGETPKRKRPTKERAALIRALANLGLIRKMLAESPDDTKAAQAEITALANTVHAEFDYDS